MSDENLYAAPEADVETPDEFNDELASRWARLGGSIIDGIIMFILAFVAAFALSFIIGDEWLASDSLVVNLVLPLILVFGIYLAVNGQLLASRGQTVGKMAVGIRIVSAEDNSRKPLSTLFGLRFVPMSVVSMIPLIGPFIGLINVLFIFRSDKRCVHDLIAGTKVVKA